MAQKTEPPKLTGRQLREEKAREFARRLRELMDQHGWNQSETARQAARHMPTGTFGRYNISAYLKEKSLPGPDHLNALAKAFRVPPSSLLSYTPRPGLEPAVPVEVKDVGGGRAWLRINKAVPWDTAVAVMKIIGEDKGRK